MSRAGFYRYRSAAPESDPDMDLRDEIQRIAVEWPCYGWRRVHAELWRRGWVVNHKPVRRIMREDNLLCLRRRKFAVATTDSKHDRPVYPNLQYFKSIFSSQSKFFEPCLSTAKTVSAVLTYFRKVDFHCSSGTVIAVG